MKIKGISKKTLAAKLIGIKMKILSEHGVMMYAHLDTAYLRERAREEILTHGDLDLAVMLIVMASVKSEPKNGP